MRISLLLESGTLDGVLDDTSVAADLATLLPLELLLSDFHAAERISDLPRRLTTTEAPAGTGAKPGDIAYYAPWGNLALFYATTPYADGLVRLGQLEGNAAEVLAHLPENAAVRITATKR